MVEKYTEKRFNLTVIDLHKFLKLETNEAITKIMTIESNPDPERNDIIIAGTIKVLEDY